MSQSRQLAAIMFTDIVGYTALMGEDEAKALELLEINRQLHKDLARQTDGDILKEMGDGTLLRFNSPTNAIRFALELQKQGRTTGLSKKLRIGIHLGDVRLDNKDVFGEGVNIASRLQSLADPGGIYVSEDIQRLVRSQGKFEFHPLGNVSLKNVSHPVKTYAIKAPYLPQPTLKKHKWVTIHTVIVGVLLVVLVITGLILINQHLVSDKTLDAVAVLPFENVSDNPEQNYLAAGMTDILVTFLSRISALTVISNVSTKILQAANLSAREIGQELGVDALIIGSVLREDEAVRITVQMVDVTTEEVLWSNSYLRDMESILQLHSELAQAIANEISVMISPSEVAELKAVPIVNPDSYENLLKGLYHLYKLNFEQYDIALEYFEKALVKEPENTGALAGIALVWVHKGQWGGEDPRLAASLAKKYAFMALSIDPEHPMANMAMAHVYTSYEWKWDLAKQAFLKTISLNPNASEPRVFYADLLVSLHETKEAIAQIDSALQVDPLNAFSHCVKGWVMTAAGQFDQAVESLSISVESEPDIPLSHRCLWTIYHLRGDYASAIKHAILFYRNQELDQTADDLQKIYRESGYKEAMAYAADRLADRSKLKYVHAMRIARLYTFCDKKATALDWLEKSYDERYTSLLSLNVDPHWSSLHQEPRFRSLLGKMNLTL